MRIQSLFIVTLIFSIALSCKNEKKYEAAPEGFQYRIIKTAPNGIAIKNDNILTLNLKYYTSKDSLLFNSDELKAKFRVKVGNAEDEGMIQDALKMLKTGDSASFLIPAENFYTKTKHDSLPKFLAPNEKLRFEIKVTDIVSKQELSKEFKQYMLKKEAEEKQILNEYITSEGITEKPAPSGIYVLKLKNGKGEKAETGKTVTINFKGMYINGQIFDSSLDKGKPLSFVLGDKNAIPAWNEAIANMRVGDKIKLIAPSNTAYGSEGIKNYVPPFTTLIYEIKLTDVK